MKSTRHHRRGESREMLLKEFFLNASLLALLKALGEEGVKFAGQLMAKPQPVPVRVRVRNRR